MLEELLGITAFDFLDDAGKALFAERMRRTLAGEQVEPSVEYRVKRKDGGSSTVCLVQEALTNVLRQAGAQRVSIMLECRKERVVAIIEDGWKGCPLAPHHGGAVSHTLIGTGGAIV